MMASMRQFIRLVVILLTISVSLPAVAAPSQRQFLGRWLIAGAHPAPWSVPGDAPSSPFDARIVGKAIVYERTRITGPRLLACRHPDYQLQQVPPEGLFQGGLTAPAAQAAALGFRGDTILTLQTGCAGGIDFHFVNQSTALFALDNMVYTIRKQ